MSIKYIFFFIFLFFYLYFFFPGIILYMQIKKIKYEVSVIPLLCLFYPYNGTKSAT